MKLVKGTVFEFDSISIDSDHVHFFVGARIKYFPSKVMKIMKSITTKRTLREYSKLKHSYEIMNCVVILESTLEPRLWHNL